MQFFELLLILLMAAILLLQGSRRLGIPYPTMLAAAGVGVAMIPGTPEIAFDPHLALALFIAPALVDAGYDLPPRELHRNWRPLLSLAVFAILLTTACVALVGWAFAGLPIFAAVALGAIVAPPDAAAATAVLGRFTLPRATVSVLKGESLLNDATALLIFSVAVSAATMEMSGASLALRVAVAVPGGVLLGAACGWAYVKVVPFVEGTLGGTLFEFVATFGVWVIAEALHLSAILCVVTYAMTLARYVPQRQRPRDRVHSYSVWEAVVFLTNVLAFLMMGLQAKGIVVRMSHNELREAVGFALGVLAVVIVVRLAWVMLYGVLARRNPGLSGSAPVPSAKQGLLVSWSGMRGLVTLATAFALPAGFPSRDLIVLTAFGVVLGTLVLQGVTLGPLIRRLKMPDDHSFAADLSAARMAVLDAGLAKIAGRRGDEVDRVRAILEAERVIAADPMEPQAESAFDKVQLKVIHAERVKLNGMRSAGEIDDDVFHALEEELDWYELSAASGESLEIEEG